MATITEQEHDRLPFPEENEAPKSPPTRRKRAFRQRHWLIAAILAPIFLVALLPTIVAHSPIITRIIRNATADLNGTVSVRSVSLGWFSPLVLRGVVVHGPDDQPLLEVPEARGESSLLGLLGNAARAGHLRLREPKLTLVLREGGSNLEDAIAAYLKAEGPQTTDVALEVTDGTVSVQEARTRRTWQIEKFQLTWNMPLDQSKPVEWKVSGVVADARQNGQFDGALRIRRGESGRTGAAGDEAAEEQQQPSRDELTLKTEAVPLAMFDPLVRRFVPGMRLAGRLSSSVQAYSDGRPAGGKTVLKGDIAAGELQVSHPALGNDQPRLERLRAGGRILWQNGLLQCDRVVTESDVGKLTLSGTLDLSDSSAAARLAAALRQPWEVSGNLDLARLAAILPNTLRIRKETQVTSGQLQLAMSSHRGPEGMAWQGRLEASNLSASRGGRNLLWQQPILITLAAHDGRQGPVIDDIKCQSNFLTASASGTRDELGGSASFDLSKLADQTAGFVDLGGLRVNGDGWANFNWKRLDQGSFEANVDLQIDRFQWGLPDRPTWTEDRFAASFSAAGRTDLLAHHRVDTAVARLEAGPDVWEVRLMKPVVDFHLGPAWPLEVHCQGQLARWQPRLGTWFAAHQWKLGGDYELLSEVSLGTDGIGLRQARCNVTQLVLENPSWNVREPKLEASVTGSWNRSARRLELEAASLKTSTVGAEVTRFLWNFPREGPPELSGTIVYEAALDRLQQSKVINLSTMPAWRMAGNLSGRLEFLHSGGPIFARCDAVLKNLNIVHTSGQRYQEKEIRLVGRGSYNHLSRSFVIDQAELTSGTLAGSASGRVTGANGQTELQLTGKIDYDLERLSELLRSRYGEGIRIVGRGSSPVSFRGPWGSDRAVATASLNWAGANVYGFQVGPGEIQAAYSRGAFEARPMTLDVNEGRVQLAPRLRITPAPATLILSPGNVMDQVRLTPATCAYALQYVAPVLAGIATAEGRFSIDLDGCTIPLADPSRGELAGRLTIHSAQIGPGYLWQEMAALLGRSAPAQLARQSVIPFQMTQGRIYHRDMSLVFPEVTIRTYGSVGLDQTLAMVAEMPVPPGWQSAGIVGTALKNQTIQLPIGGTLRQPKIDRRALDQLNRQFLQNAARNVLEDKLHKGLDRILQPPQPKR